MKPIIDVIELSKQLGNKTVLAHLSFTVEEGEFIGLIGPNGAGKTTLLKCLSGQLTVPEGTATICGSDVSRNTLQAKQQIGYAVDPSLLPMQLTGIQFLEFVAAARSKRFYRDQNEYLIELLALTADIENPIGTYSHGTKQKLSITAALMNTPPLILLDESLNGLDPLSAYRLKQHLQEKTEQKTATVILSSHLIDSVEKYCSRIILLLEGRIKKIWTREELADERTRTKKDLEQLFVESMKN